MVGNTAKNATSTYDTVKSVGKLNNKNTAGKNTMENQTTAKQKTATTVNETTTKKVVKINDVYKKVLKDVKKGKYSFPDSNGSKDYYFLRDMNNDGIKELIVAPKSTQLVYTWFDIRVFTGTKSEQGYKLQPISGHQVVSDISTDGGVCLPKDGNN